MTRTPATPRRPKPATAPRDPAFSSGDRNTKSSEQDWPTWEGGIQRDGTPAVPPRENEATRPAREP